MLKNYLIEKTYDMYKLEISRREKLENKAVGYFTIYGILLTAFLVIVLAAINGFWITDVSIKGIMSFLILVLSECFIILFVVSVFYLHKVYSPKKRPEFDAISNYDTLVGKIERKAFDEIRKNLIEIIKYYGESNELIANKLIMINFLAIISTYIIISIFVIYIIGLFI